MHIKLLLLPILLAAVLLLAGCASVPIISSCPSSCDDKNSCTQDYCNASTNGTCVHASFEGFSCNNSTGICKAGVCVAQNSSSAGSNNGGGPAITYDSRRGESESYWRSTRPWQIVKHAQSANGDLTLVIQNVEYQQYKLNNISVAGGAFAGFYSTPTYFSGGESKTIRIPLYAVSEGACNAGDVYEYYVNFSYDETGDNPISGLTQYGTRNIIGKCS